MSQVDNPLENVELLACVTLELLISFPQGLSIVSSSLLGPVVCALDVIAHDRVDHHNKHARLDAEQYLAIEGRIPVILVEIDLAEQREKYDKLCKAPRTIWD